MQARQIFAKDKKIFYRFYGFPFLFFLSGNPEYTTEKRRKKTKHKTIRSGSRLLSTCVTVTKLVARFEGRSRFEEKKINNSVQTATVHKTVEKSKSKFYIIIKLN